MSIAIALCSGGLHSATAAALAQQSHKLLMLHVQRPPAEGQPDAGKERRAAFTRLASALKPMRTQVIQVPLSDPHPAPAAGSHAALAELLPLIGLAGRVASVADAVAIYTGVTGGSDPSAAAEVLQVWEELLRCTVGRDVRVEAPLLDMEDWQRVELARQVGVPVDLCHADDPEAREAAVRRAA